MKEIDFRSDLLPHKDRLYRLAMGILLDSAEAEDTVEDTLIKVWEQHRSGLVQNISNLPAYLTTLCRNLAIDRSRRLSTHQVSLTEAAEIPSEDNAETRERYNRALTLIHSLTEPQRSCLLLRDVEGLSYQQIAQQLGLTEAQVKVNIHRGREKVRQLF